MRKEFIRTLKLAVIGFSAAVLVWIGASWMDIVSHNLDDKKIVYVNEKFVEVSPYASWNFFEVFK